MANGRIALCIDGATRGNPSLLGLQGESLGAQDWLAVFTEGDEAREAIGGAHDITEVWVASCDDVEPINLAATLKADRPDLHVCLVEFNGCGSLFSRAHTASIDEVLERAPFMSRYAQQKRAHAASAARAAIPAVQETPCVPHVHGAAPIAAPAPAMPYGTEPAPQRGPATRALAAPPRGNCFIMPVVSGSGGAGKSTVAVLSALHAHRRGLRTLLLDYDLQFGDADVLAGAEGALAVDEALSQPARLERELMREGELVVLAAPARIESADEVVRRMSDLLDVLAESFDVIIANTGAAWAEQHAVLLERASAALFLVDQRASSVRACRHALELCMRCGIATGPFQFALNRCAKNAPLSSIDVSCALQGAAVFELKDGGRDVEDYLGGGGAAELLDTGNDLCASLEDMLGRMLPGGLVRIPEGKAAREPRRAAKRKAKHADRRRGWAQ